MVKIQMAFGPKPSRAHIRKNIARIMTELSQLKKNSQ
jgi:ribosomal protein L29